MRIAVPRESVSGERRVALVPDHVGRLIAAGAEVVVQAGAGAAAHFPDAAFAAVGATVVHDESAVMKGAHVIARVRRPTMDQAALLDPDSILIGLLQPGTSPELFHRLAERRVTALSLELVPRITRAQSMDVLSSQSTVTGYEAVLVGAGTLGRFLPMLTTAAGSIPPARVFVIGAGVAGLQAIATARRLGAIVSAFDVRSAAAEQVESLGATFIAAEALSARAEASGGYARSQSESDRERTLEAIARHLPAIDLVITTAQIPGRPAPRLITDAMIASMKAGSVIVDLAAESGGNSDITRPDERVDAHGVVVLGPTNLASNLPVHASQMFGRNVLALLQHLMKDGAIAIDLADEITAAMAVTHAGRLSQ
ncbi:MAG: Re/Si-specific NAD(P)(+) transhydrogenase subunit alpha [Gemmatimonadota bacterium]|nr:Re/Si-specific NAD(P)(+) transhydrogenase subunit alpha [Gemmatimonadota bacterium]